MENEIYRKDFASLNLSLVLGSATENADLKSALIEMAKAAEKPLHKLVESQPHQAD